MKKKDIAAMLNVSQSTVSRVLSSDNTRSVSDELKEKIISLAIQNGIKIKTKRYGIIIGSHAEKSDDPYFSDIVQCLTEEFKKFSYYRMFIYTSLEISVMNELDFQQICENIDGIILISAPQLKIWERISKITRNIICIDANFSYNPFIQSIGEIENKYSFSKISYNTFDAARKCVEHLVSLGHKNIIFIGGEEDPSGELRYLGYCQGLADANIPFDKNLVYYTNYDIDGGGEIARRIYGKVCFTAAVCLNDNIAIGFMNTLISMGAKVPSEIMVIGFNNIKLAEYNIPSLTTVKVDFEAIGYICATIMTGHIEKKITNPVNIFMELDLIKRQSTLSQCHRE